ncbi:hypothetical protein, partial [Zoogloea sp.]|uniref:hypothetical protein n=1 Tax=Zoogloea sp. TaxID=49181 RepID=UPI002638ADE9
MAAVYGEGRVNYYTNDYQYSPQAAGLTGGGYVLTWVSRGQDGSVDGIYAQRYNASGSAVGAEFRVNTQRSGDQTNPAIVGLSDGGFAIAWTDQNGDGSSSGVYAQRFDASGLAQGSQFRINTYTDYDQNHPALAAFDGGFVATWFSRYQDGSGTGIYAQRYSNDGSPLGSEFPVNTSATYDQYEPRVSTFTDGSFVIVWRSDYQDGSGAGVYGQRFDASGNKAGGEFAVNTTTTSSQYDPHVVTLAGGGFVVVWADDSGHDGSANGVYAQRFDASGVKLGGEFLINESTGGNQYQPEVSALANGGFVVSWYNESWGSAGTYADVYVREYQADGTPAGGEVRVNTPGAAYYQYEPTVAHIGSDNFIVAWRSDDQDGSSSGVYQQLFGSAAELVRPAAPTLADFGGSVTFGENLVNTTPQVLDSFVSFTAADGASFDGGVVTVFFASGGGVEDQLSIRNQGSAFGQIGVAGSTVSYGGVDIGSVSGGGNGGNLTVTLNAAASTDAIEALVQNIAYGNSAFSPQASRQVGVRIEDGHGASTAAGLVTINVTRELDGTPAAYGEEPVNTFTPSDQSNPAIGRLTDGGYVIAWNSYLQDTSTWGTYAQRYTASGEAVGPEFRVNTITAGEQSYPQVAGLSNGGYVITWQDDSSHEGSGWGWGVFAQRYNADGSTAGSPIVVNTTTESTQFHGVVASYTDGFAVAWSSDSYVAGGNGHDIYLTRYDNAGNVQGTPQQRVSVTPGTSDAQPGGQDLPRIAAHANGDLVIVWRDSNGNDGSGWGVFGRTYSAAGGFGDTFQVNTTTTGTQYNPDVATLADGGFVVVWEDHNGLDGSSYATFAQRYDLNGAAVGDALQVNENTNGAQYQAKVSGLATGGFVVAFYNDTGDYWGDVYLREFDASGQPVDGDRRVNGGTAGVYRGDSAPAIADLGNGNFVVAWQADNHSDGSGSGIFQRVFGDTAELPRQARPDLSDFSGTVTFNENAVNAGLRIIDGAVSLSDTDSANFAGGRLDLNFTSGGASEDQLGVVSEGPISVAGNVVSYAGNAIGTLTGGTNGSALRIDFTSTAATPDAVEALVQHLGYANTDSSPNASRTLALRISDGDGASSTPNQLTINVTPELDGTPAAYGEEPVNTFT